MLSAKIIIMGYHSIYVKNHDLDLFIYPEVSRKELSEDFYKLEQLCDGGINFVHNNDIIELQTIVVEPYRINLFFRSLRGLLMNKKPVKLSRSWILRHFNEAIQDREILPLQDINPLEINDHELVKLLLLLK
jgi:hypothetical protein